MYSAQPTNSEASPSTGLPAGDTKPERLRFPGRVERATRPQGLAALRVAYNPESRRWNDSVSVTRVGDGLAPPTQSNGWHEEQAPC